jgi:hypothetical protein
MDQRHDQFVESRARDRIAAIRACLPHDCGGIGLLAYILPLSLCVPILVGCWEKGINPPVSVVILAAPGLPITLTLGSMVAVR